MTTHTSLLDLSNQLIHDETARSAFAADPDGFLAEHGIVDLTPAEVASGLGHVADALPPHLAVQLGPPGDGDAGSLVEQFRAVADVDPDLTIPELDDAGDALDGPDGSDGEVADLDPHDHLDGLGDEAEASADEADEPAAAADDADDSSDLDTADLGFGSGGDEVDADVADATGFEVDLADELADLTTPVADLGDPAAFDDTSSGFEDQFLAPDPVDTDPGDPDDLDSDNGNWDGSWDHDDGHGML